MHWHSKTRIPLLTHALQGAAERADGIVPQYHDLQPEEGGTEDGIGKNKTSMEKPQIGMARTGHRHPKVIGYRS